MELAIANTPAIAGQVYVCPDVSGSMRSPITGQRKGAATAVRCVDAAALMTAAFVRQNPSAEVLPFEDSVVQMDLSWRDSVMTNSERLASIGGGGTCVSVPLAQLNARKARGELVVIVSDNESWIDANSARGTATMREWNAFRSRNPNARLVLIDLQPYATTQVVDRQDILNIGGFRSRVRSCLGVCRWTPAQRGLGRQDRVGGRLSALAGPECLRDYILSRCRRSRKTLSGPAWRRKASR